MASEYDVLFEKRAAEMKEGQGQERFSKTKASFKNTSKAQSRRDAKRKLRGLLRRG
jgi:hypothetical protein